MTPQSSSIVFGLGVWAGRLSVTANFLIGCGIDVIPFFTIGCIDSELGEFPALVVEQIKSKFEKGVMRGNARNVTKE